MHIGRCCHCGSPPVPWPGRISRFLYPTAITDYESLQQAAWSTANFFDTFNGAAGAPQFGGTEYSCYYHVVEVADESIDNVSVIMQPIRYTLDVAAVADDYFDYWIEGTTEPVAPQTRDVNSWVPLNSPGFLPISGNSHVSDGKVGELYLRDILDFGGWLNAWQIYGGWSPTTNTTPLPLCLNWEVTPRYLRMRQNGTAIGTLFDFEPYWDTQRAQLYTVGVTGGLMGRNAPQSGRMCPTGYSLFYATSAQASWFPTLVQSAELTLVAGDTLEVDIWYQFRGRPLIYRGEVQQASQSRNIIGSISRHVVSTEERRKTDDKAGYTGGPITSLHKSMWLANLKVSDGFNPATHTYTFEAVGGTWNFGDGSPGAKKAQAGSGWNAPTITSQQLSWDGTLSGSSGGGLTFSESYSVPGAGQEMLSISFNSVSIGDEITIKFAGGGAVFTYTSTTNDYITFSLALETAVNNFITAQGADGYWETANAVDVIGVLEITYSDTISPLEAFAGSGGPLGGGYISVILDWRHEIAELLLYIVPPLPETSRRWSFRPQNSADYVTQVTDRREGTLNSSPCGVFSHLGTTTFVPWYGTRDPAVAIPVDSDRPTSITVVQTTI